MLRHTRAEMRAIRDRLLLELAAGRRIRVRDWAAEHAVHWQRVYEWLQEIQCNGVLMIVLTRRAEYVRADRCRPDEVADR